MRGVWRKAAPAAALAMLVIASGCKRQESAKGPQPKGYGAAVTEVSGGKQAAFVGSVLDQPLVVQVNDAQGNPVPGALVTFAAEGKAAVTPVEGLTGDDGQLTVACQLGDEAGRYRITAATRDKQGKAATLDLDEIALGYQENLGRQLNERYCSRCHNQESTAARVSNYDNLATKPHSFSDGAFYNAVSDADITAMIQYGGAARHQSAEMPSYGGTLDKAEVEALVAYVRAIADPPHRQKGLVYARQ
jgi:mono/diheme cytochrome c family protein